MWNASVNAICDRAHGTGFTASTRSGAWLIAESLLVRLE